MRHFLFAGPWLCLGCVTTFALSGCATIFHSSTEEIQVTSKPDQAAVLVNGEYVGTTPLRLELAPKYTYSIDFQKDGYANRKYIVNHFVGAGWVILDLFGMVLPILVDGVTGDWYTLDTDHVHGVLEPANPG